MRIELAQAVPGRFLVRFRPGSTGTRQHANGRLDDPAIKSVRPLGGAKKGSVQLAGAEPSFFDEVALVEVHHAEDLKAVLERTARHPDVQYVEPDYRLRIASNDGAQRVPNDFEFRRQWSFQKLVDGVEAGISAADAWQVSVGDRRVKVAVIDTGIDYFHPDLEANIWNNPGEIPGNGIDDDQNGYTDDFHGFDFVSRDGDPVDDQIHGTHVAGIIGAAGNNRQGVVGVCWEVTLLALKAFNESGDGAASDVIEAINYAISNGARIINASWSTKDRSKALDEALVAAYRAGVLIVAAAGNDRNDTPNYPASSEHVLSVAATDKLGQKAAFSSYGQRVDVAAPGDAIYSTVPNCMYDILTGTSMSAPHVSGIAALVWAAHPEFSVTEIENVLRNSVDPLAGDYYIGMGRINAGKALSVSEPLPHAALLLPEVVSGHVDILGTATGKSFAGYKLAYGRGTYPTNWTEFHSSAEPVEDGVLVKGYSTEALGEGGYVFRLTVADSSGRQSMDLSPVTVRNVSLSHPGQGDVLRAGETVVIKGTVFGMNRQYTLVYGEGWQPAEWTTNGIQLINGGAGQILDGALATWDTSRVPTNKHYTLRLTARTAGEVTGESQARLVYFESRLKPGWPLYMDSPGQYPTNDWRDITVADLDDNGIQEIIRVDAGDTEGRAARLLVYEPDGSLLWSRVLADGEPVSDIAVAGDLDGDGYQEIVVDAGCRREVFAFRHDGTVVPGSWPVQLDAAALGKVLADLDGDGKMELVCLANEPLHRADGDIRPLIVIDSNGAVRQKWELAYFDALVDAPRMFPAVGNLDDDPELEIVAVSGPDEISAFKLSQPAQRLWKARTQGVLVASPVVGDINGDGLNEVVIGAHDSRAGPSGGTQGGLYAFDATGLRLPGWPVLIEESFSAAPALADLDFDGDLEIIVPSWLSFMVHVVHHTGFEAAGWPVGPLNKWSARSSPVVGDINGDVRPDVVMICPGRGMQAGLTGNLSALGGVMAWNADGQEIDLDASLELHGLLMESAGGTRLKAAPPVLTDLDGNGRMDIVASTVDDWAFPPDAVKSTAKKRYTLYAWELDVPYAASTMIWPMFRADPQHTGYLPPPVYTNQPPVVTNVPDQVIRSGGTFFPISLDHYVMDPDDAPSRLTWTIEGSQQLRVSIDTNRVVTVLVPSPDWAGQETIRFIARDPGGLTGEDAATYSARPDYNPPVPAPDHVTVLEDESIEVDVLSNDIDPENSPIELLDVGRPLFGSVQLTPQATVVYTPTKDYNGPDSFTYTIRNARDGVAMGSVSIVVQPVNDPPWAEVDWVITDEDTPVVVDVMANDFDVDGDAFALVDFAQPESGAVQLQAPGLLLYTPNLDFMGLDKFTYRLQDVGGLLTVGEVYLQVKPVNDAPVARDQAFTLNRNTEQSIIYQAVDAEGAELTFRVVDGPEHGELWTYPKVATYHPLRSYAGPDRLTYVASDGEVESNVATITFDVLAVNNTPEPKRQTVVTKVGRSVPVNLEATDPDEEPIEFNIVEMPAHGALEGSGAEYTYHPKTGFIGEDSFRFTASDGQATSLPAKVTLTVTDQNSAPTASDTTIRVSPGTAGEVTLPATDGENDPLTYTLVTQPESGRISGDPPTLLYTPEPDFVGYDRFTFKASDGELESEIGTVTIVVAVPNHEPESKDNYAKLPATEPWPVPLDAQDADGDTLRTAILKGPQHGILIGLGTNLVYRPTGNFMGSDSFTYRLWDGHAYGRVTKVSIFVSSIVPGSRPIFEGPPRIKDGLVLLTIRAREGQALQVQASTNLSDWQVLGTLIGQGTAIEWQHTNGPDVSARFYRTAGE